MQLPIAENRDVRAFAFSVLRRFPARLLLVVLVFVAANAAGLLVPALVGQIVSELQKGKSQSILPLVAAIVFAVIVQAIIGGVGAVLSANVGERVLAQLRESFMADILRLPVSVLGRVGSGDLLTRATRDVDALSTSVRTALPDSAISTVTLALTLVALGLQSPWFLVPCFAAVPLLWASTRWYLKRSGRGYLKVSATYSDLTSELTETLEGAVTVEALRLAKHRNDRMNRSIGRSYSAETFTLNLRSTYLPLADSFYVLPTVLVFVGGALLYSLGLVGLAAATAGVLYAQQLIDPLDRLLFWLDQLQVSAVSVRRLLGVAAVKNADHSIGTPDPPSKPFGPSVTVGIRRLSYSYYAGRRALDDINLEIERGQHVAIVGPSGSGKSTLVKAIAGLEPVSPGSVFINGRDIAELDYDLVRSDISVVAQDEYIFGGSLLYNLELDDSTASLAEVWRALDVVGASSWAKAVGLDNDIRTRPDLTGPAQSQQLALARVLLRDPDVLVLDEATSLLDPKSAADLERKMFSLLKQKTVISVAHRLHTAQLSDKVFLMDHGQIIEEGSHDALLRRNGRYADLWRIWSGGHGR